MRAALPAATPILSATLFTLAASASIAGFALEVSATVLRLKVALNFMGWISF